MKRESRVLTSLRLAWFAFACTLLVQAGVGGVIACMEFIGLGNWQRQALSFVESLIDPGIRLFTAITPASWQSQGNILLGFVAVGFTAVLYAAVVGISLGATTLIGAASTPR